jgi:MoaA/NifB/PqqE/SkfB family radical SAM enzyme
VYRRHWQNRHLSLATFQRLLPDLKKVSLVYLQGWGEPFLHPDFFTFVSLAKEAGCQVGATTNATLLTTETITRIVESGIDVLAFSLAGLGGTNDAWRQGTSYGQVLDAIRSLQTCKRRLGKDNPRVHIAYMLLRSGIPDLAGLPEAFKGLGISQVVTSTLDLVAAPELERESLALASGAEGLEIMKRLKAVAEAGARSDLVVHYPRRQFSSRRPDCPENVLRAAVISATGDISPCVYTNIPTSAGVFYFKGESHKIRQFFCGNLQKSSFQEIWRQLAYRRFRRSWRGGELANPCQNCLKLPIKHF